MALPLRAQQAFNSHIVFLPTMLFAFSSCFASAIYADVYSNFDSIAGPTTGEFGWDSFTGDYSDAHSPDVIVAGGLAVLTASPSGGLITSTQNLYSFFTVPTVTFELSALEQSQSLTSVGLQIAASETFLPSQFLLNSNTPNEFLNLGQRVSSGGFDYHFYWVEWQGLTAASNFTINVQANGQHSSFAGAKIVYFNSDSIVDIRSVPEPSSLAFLVAFALFATARYRKPQRRT